MKEINEPVRVSRKQQAEDSRHRIYEAARTLIAQKGFLETNITDICRVAGCSVGAFYHHFPTKESILEETFRLADAQFSGWKKLDASDQSGREMIVSYMKAYATLVSEESGLEFSKHFYNFRNKIFIRKGRPMQNRLVEIIKTALEEKELQLEMTAEDACEWIFMGARGVVFHWCLNEGSFNLIDRMELYTRRALKGIEIRD